MEKLVLNYIKYGLFVLTGFVISAIIVVANADDIILEGAENDHEEAIELFTKHSDYLDKYTTERDLKIQEIMNDYAPLIEEQEKFVAQGELLLCKTESRLAKAKLQENLKGRLELTDDDIRRLSEKILWKCGKNEPVEVSDLSEIDELLIEACAKHATNQETCPKIMKGVFQADSSQCTKGAGATNLNCGNVRPGSGKYGDPDVEWTVNNNFRKYETLRAGVFDNVAVYAQLYEGQSIDYMRRVWARGGQGWADTVNQYANA